MWCDRISCFFWITTINSWLLWFLFCQTNRLNLCKVIPFSMFYIRWIVSFQERPNSHVQCKSIYSPICKWLTCMIFLNVGQVSTQLQNGNDTPTPLCYVTKRWHKHSSYAGALMKWLHGSAIVCIACVTNILGRVWVAGFSAVKHVITWHNHAYNQVSSGL